MVWQWSVAILAGGSILASAVPPHVVPLDAVLLLDQYERGDYAAVARDLASVDDVRVLDHLDSELAKGAKGWIAAGNPSQTRRRAFVAGAVALEVTHALVDGQTSRAGWTHDSANPEALPRVVRLIANEVSPPDDLEHDWTLAQLASWEEWNAAVRLTAGDQWITPEPVWAVLLGEPTLMQLSRTQTAFGQGGYLQEALARFPGDERLLLAREEGRESIETRCPIEFCFDEMTPGTLDQLRRRAKSAPPETGGLAQMMNTRTHAMAVANLEAFDRLLPAASRFAALANAHPGLRAEANVHIGYLAIRAERPEMALRPLADAVVSDDPHVRYLAEYFTGRAFDALGRRPDAIAAFRRALVVVPDAPSAAMLLAAQLFVGDDSTERTEAYAVLQAAQAAVPRAADPWDRYWYGDARLWPVYMEHLRQALRQ
jgi:tetratricopeptide (TPR) repeat protein